MLWHLIVLTTIKHYESTLSQPDCISNGEPCIAAAQGEPCTDSVTLIQNSDDFDKDDFLDPPSDNYPWSFEAGSTRTLCCGAQTYPPLLESTVQLEWYYYSDPADFGLGEEKYVLLRESNSTRYTINTSYAHGSRNYSHLTIEDIRLSDRGIYMCKATASTRPPPASDALTSPASDALTLARLFDPFVIDVYSPSISFEEPRDNDNTPTVEIPDRFTAPYVILSYALQPLNPNKTIAVKVTTKEELLQYIDVRDEYKIIVNTHGPIEYPQMFTENFLIEISYEGEYDTFSLSRGWDIQGNYAITSSTVFIPEEENDFQEDLYYANKTYPFYVVGSCDAFVWSVTLDASNSQDYQQLTFDGSFTDSFSTLESDGNARMDYRFVNSYTSGELKTKNAYLEAMFYRTQSVDKNIEVRLRVYCAADTSEEYTEVKEFDVIGLPMFSDDEKKNCVTYEDDNFDAYPVSYPTQQDPCCSTKGKKYPAHLWINGVRQSSNDYKIAPLQTEEVEVAQKKYEWFQEFAGFYQCFVSDYLSIPKKLPRIPATKSRSFIMGFAIASMDSTITFQEENVQGFIQNATAGNATNEPAPAMLNVTRYINTGDDQFFNYNLLVVLDGTCLKLFAFGTTYPLNVIEWESAILPINTDNKCSTPHDSDRIDQNNNKDIFYPYDRIRVESTIYVGPVNKSKNNIPYEVKAKLDDEKTNAIKIIALAPFLQLPKMTETSGFITCIVTGYPIDSVTLKYENEVRGVWSLSEDYENDKSTSGYTITREGYEVTLVVAITGKGWHSCRAVNSLLKTNGSLVAKIKVLTFGPTSNNLFLIIAAVIGSLILLLLLWVICGCIRMAKHPHTKLAQAMCCVKSSYSLVDEKIPLKDPLKLNYATLNPGSTLGGGHFGIVRKGYSSYIPDRIGEKTIIAIKEVKPCVDRSRREDDLRREKDIMMALRGHRNIIKIFGYTDEPDTLSLVVEYAMYGSLDDLLRNARKMKTDGYMLPNEHSNNPIEAFEAKHIMDFGRQIADGMDYIGKHMIVHRDLAARNVVVAGDEHEYILKVTDFGLAREISSDGIYERVLGKEIPIKWTAPDSLINDKYTAKSDVWSYGVTLWELCTLGGEPYAGFANAEVTQKVRSGLRLQKPPCSNDELYSLMNRCWEENPDDRPDFNHILTQLTEYCQQPSQYLRIEDLYETDLNLALKLPSLSLAQPNNHATPSNNTTTSLSRALSRDLSREPGGLIEDR